MTVIPVVRPPEAVPARDTWELHHLLIIDNTTLGLWADWCKIHKVRRVALHRNLGVATSWNLGARWAWEDGWNAVAFISSSVYWPQGSDAFTNGQWHAYGDPERGLLTTGAFHASIWARAVFEEIGYFDENFFAYEEDIDWLRRCEIAGIHVPPERREESWKLDPTPMPKVELAGTCEDAVSLKSGAVNVDIERSKRYYLAKWGGPKHDEKYDRPFGLWTPLDWWPVLREI